MDEDALKKAREIFARRLGVASGYVPSSVGVPVKPEKLEVVQSIRTPVSRYLPGVGMVGEPPFVMPGVEKDVQVESKSNVLQREPVPVTRVEELPDECEPELEVESELESEPELKPKKNGNGRILAPVTMIEEHDPAPAITRAHAVMVEQEKQEKVEKAVKKKFEKELEEGSRMTYEILRREMEKEKDRILNSLRLAYRSEAFRSFKSGKCTHEEFELELLRLLKEEKQWSK